MPLPLIPQLNRLPSGLPEGAVGIELEEGIPVFRASGAVQARIESLLAKQVADRFFLCEFCYASEK